LFNGKLPLLGNVEANALSNFFFLKKAFSVILKGEQCSLRLGALAVFGMYSGK